MKAAELMAKICPSLASSASQVGILRAAVLSGSPRAPETQELGYKEGSGAEPLSGRPAIFVRATDRKAAAMAFPDQGSAS